jgi:predicted O-methyltransferase YrrM
VWAFAALTGASESGILDELATPKTAAEIGQRIGASPALAQAILEVLAALDVVRVEEDRFFFSSGMKSLIGGFGKDILRGDLRATHLLTLDLVERFQSGALSSGGWQYADPVILQAWGMRSVEQVALWIDRVFSTLDGLGEALQTPESRFLDVGTGVGRLAIAMCGQLPNLRVLGIDPNETALNLARQNVMEAGVGDRIELRRLRVQDLGETESFDLAWVPVMFLDPATVANGLHRVHAALRRGGWLIVGTVDAQGQGIQPKVLKLMSLLFSGGLVLSQEVAEMLEQAGYDGVKVLPAPPGLPNRTVVARRPID